MAGRDDGGGERRGPEKKDPLPEEGVRGAGFLATGG